MTKKADAMAQGYIAQGSGKEAKEQSLSSRNSRI
jgi:hypothetical protein